jgi:hypothetical protein
VSTQPIGLDDLDEMDLDAAEARPNGTRHGSGPTPIDLEAPVPPSAAPQASPIASRLVSVPPDWLTTPPPPREYLAIDSRTGQGGLPARGVAILGAAGGAGKSYLTIALALAVASGTDWIGVMRIVRAARVLVASAEEPADELRRRLYYGAASGRVATSPAGAIDLLDLHDVHVPLLDHEGHATEHAAALVALVHEHGPYALVVVDPLARLAGAPIDADNVAAGALVSVLESVATAAGGLVVAVHHTSLTARRAGDVGATALRGATGLGDSARMVLTLGVERVKHDDGEVGARLGEIVTLRAAKANNVRRWEPIELRRGEQGELLPLDAADRALLDQARQSADTSAAQRTAREADREARRTRDAAEREAGRDARDQAAASRASEIDAAAATAVGETPGIGAADLRTAVRARARCGADAADVAVRRMVDRGLVRREGTHPVRHYPTGTALDDEATP